MPMNHGQHTERQIATVIAACERYGKSSIIALAGVPGTGKSHIAAIAAQRLTGEPTLVREIQFHPSYTYEEFIEGMRLDSTGGVETLPGVFLEWNERALDDPNQKYVLLLEELTRGNVSSILGELMTYVEHRERPFFSMYSRKAINVAPNLIILATYNPIDRSAIEIDAALLRRLRVIDFPPSVGQLSEMLEGKLPASVVASLCNLFEACKAEFGEDYERLMPFGHGVFSEVRDEPELNDLWNQRISRFVRRPVLGAHPFADTIEANYPWRDSGYRVTLPIEAAPSVAKVSFAGGEQQGA
jgi:5-methylcytosine-specific restriction protein B